MEPTTTFPKVMTIGDLPRLKWSIEEYHKLIEQGFLADKKVELLNGEIIEMVPEGPEHADANGEAHEYLILLLGDRAKVRNAKPVTLPDGFEPEPDISVCERREYRSHHPYPENIFWLIEYANTSLDRDLKIKSKIYAEVGIEEYWIVNIQKGELIVMREPEGDAYQTEFRLKEGIIAPLAFQDLAIDVLKIVNSREVYDKL